MESFFYLQKLFSLVIRCLYVPLAILLLSCNLTPTTNLSFLLKKNQQTRENTTVAHTIKLALPFLPLSLPLLAPSPQKGPKRNPPIKGEGKPEFPPIQVLTFCFIPDLVN
jgi:hypothetical protein